MAVSVDGPRKVFKAAANYSTKKFFIVWLGNGIATLADDADVLAERIMGVIQVKPEAATNASVVVQMPWGGGSGKVLAATTIVVGDELTTDSSGEAIPTTTSDDYIFGVALEDAVNGDVFEYMPTFDTVD